MINILGVSSCGGHFYELRDGLENIDKVNVRYVLNKRTRITNEEYEIDYVTHSERDFKFFINIYEAWVIIKKLDPDMILSYGAGVIVPFSLVAKFVYGIPIVYVETIASVNTPSLTGRIMYRIADYFFYQHETLNKFFPKGVLKAKGDNS